MLKPEEKRIFAHFYSTALTGPLPDIGESGAFQGGAVNVIIKYFRGRGSMNITDVRIRRVEKEGKMKAVVSITIDNEFAVHDIKIIEGEKGLFIAMPSRRNAEGEYRDVAHPINSETRQQIQTLIMDKYQEEIAAGI